MSSVGISAAAALGRLKDGNRRYREGGLVVEGDNARSRGVARSRLRETLAEDGQQPFAVVLGCSDSRVPVETVFTQGPGNLFVVRVAGNIAGPSQVASVEFAAQEFGSRLVVVLGHSLCGAVRATLEEAVKKGRLTVRTSQAKGPVKPQQIDNLQSITGMIRPAVEGLVADGRDVSACLAEAVRANVRSSVAGLKKSKVLMELIETEGLKIIGAEYCLQTGVVQFLE